MLDTSDAMLSLAMIAAFALILAGIWLIRAPGGNRLKAGLMIAAGLVTIFNVWVNTLPLPPNTLP
jgi:flagellar biogenesis protein FliO